MNIVDDLIKIVGSENVCQNEPMSKHTTFRIGGNADFFVTPNTTESLEAVINYVKSNNIPYYVIGNGSNLLVKDGGFRGVIIQLYKKFANITVNDNVITAQAGALLSTVAKTALKEAKIEYKDIFLVHNGEFKNNKNRKIIEEYILNNDKLYLDYDLIKENIKEHEKELTKKELQKNL